MKSPNFEAGGNYVQALDMSEPTLFVLRVPSSPVRGNELETTIRTALESFDIRHKLIVLYAGTTLEPVMPPSPMISVYPGITEFPGDDG